MAFFGILGFEVRVLRSEVEGLNFGRLSLALRLSTLLYEVLKAFLELACGSGIA
jgi:hypothetical protein